MTRTLRNLGRARHRLGEYAAARSLLNEALARARADDATTSIAATVLAQGELALEEGELAQARNLLLESIGISSWAIGNESSGPWRRWRSWRRCKPDLN